MGSVDDTPYIYVQSIFNPDAFSYVLRAFSVFCIVPCVFAIESNTKAVNATIVITAIVFIL